MVLQKKGQSIFGELAEIDVEFDKLSPTIKAWPAAIYKFNSEEQIYLEHISSWYYGDRYVGRNKVNLPSVPSGGYGLPPKRQHTYVYTENFENLFENTDLKYADVNKMNTEYAFDAYDLIRYLDLSLKYNLCSLY